MVFIRWSKGTWKDDQCCYLLKKWKSKLQQGITLHQSEWPSSESLEITNAREGFEKKKKTFPQCWWECKLAQSIWITVRRFLKKLEVELPYDPAIPLLGIYTEKNMVQNDTCTQMFTASLFTKAKTLKQPKRPSTDNWIKKMKHPAWDILIWDDCEVVKWRSQDGSWMYESRAQRIIGRRNYEFERLQMLLETMGKR